MAQLQIGNQGQGVRLLLVRKGLEEAAMAAARHNGADDVFFRSGEDLWVGSGRALALGSVRKGDSVTVAGKEGTVVQVDDQLNSWKDGALKVARIGGIAAGAAAAAGGAAAGLALVLPKAFSRASYHLFFGFAPWAGIVAAGAAAVTAVSAAGFAAYGAVRKTNLHALDAFTVGSVADPARQLTR